MCLPRRWEYQPCRSRCMWGLLEVARIVLCAARGCNPGAPCDARGSVTPGRSVGPFVAEDHRSEVTSMLLPVAVLLVALAGQDAVPVDMPPAAEAEADTAPPVFSLPPHGRVELWGSFDEKTVKGRLV